MMRFIFAKIFLFLLCAIPHIAQAAVPSWQIIPNESTLSFTGIQNDVPITGNFKTFTGKILFDPAQLADSKVQIVIDMNSTTTSYKDFTTTLLSPDWFSVKIFPQATFTANHFIKVSDNTYQADGTLTIRNKSVPVKISFHSESLSPTKVKVMGNTTLKRTAFGIGQGDWASTDDVKDEVKVNFTLGANKS